MLLVLTLGVGFVLQLRSLYYSPEFSSTPTEFDYTNRSQQFTPSNGNTIAIMLRDDRDGYATNADVRIMFESYDQNGTRTYFNAVRCADLYADQIAQEKDSSEESKFFTNTFGDTDYSSSGWICPNTTTTVLTSPDIPITFKARIVPCNLGSNDTYAENITCSTDAFDGSLSYGVMYVSTNFDAQTYFLGKKLQLAPATKWVYTQRAANTAARIDAYISSNTHNIFASDFIWSSFKENVNTTMFSLPTQGYWQRKYDFDYYSLITVSRGPIYSLNTRRWYRIYLTDFLSNFGGLSISILSFFAFLMNGFQAFSQNKAMLDSLYGEIDRSERHYRHSNLSYGTSSAI